MSHQRIKEVAENAYFVQKLTESEFSALGENPFPPTVCSDVREEAFVNEQVLEELPYRIHERSSSRTFKGPETTLSRSLDIIKMAYGYLKNGHRSIPSAGSYYPLHLYLVRVKAGRFREVYYFDPEAGKLTLHRKLNHPVSDAFFVYHVDFSGASWMILWGCSLLPIASKYGAKAYRFICFEIGHSAQMAVLSCQAQGIQHVALGGLNEKWLRDELIGSGRRILPQYSLMYR